MGRPSLGPAARTLLLATKGTQAERDALIAKYGSVYAGMRFALRLALESDVRTQGADAPKSLDGKRAEKVIVDEVIPVAPEVVPEAGVLDHRHRRGKEIDPVYEQGSKRRRWECAAVNCSAVLS